jgi:CheY-like chemotaxis protein
MNTNPQILLVDDDRLVVQYLKNALERTGYAVTATTSGKQALAHLKERMPDLLILDSNMPEPDGFDLLKTERSKFPLHCQTRRSKQIHRSGKSDRAILVRDCEAPSQ